jgi:hypothetical protein
MARISGYGVSPYGLGGYGDPQAIYEAEQPGSAETAHPVRPAKVVTLGQAAETGTALAVARAKLYPLAAAEEVSAAFGVVGRGVVRRILGQAAEQALAAAFTRRKVRRVWRAHELDEAADMTPAGIALPPTVLTARHAPATLVAASGGRSRLEARHG